MENDAIPPNTQVRLEHAPDKIGRTTGKTRKKMGRTLYQVIFADKTDYIPEGSLDIIEEEPDIYDLLNDLKFGKVINLRSAITHRRLTGKLSDIVYSMEATNTEFYPYQFKPVLNFLDSPSKGILIADEVGLGKTIEAGLIWTELRARFNANRLLILCPAVLREKWQEELAHRFGIKADIHKADELLKKLKNSTNRNDAITSICSMQGLRPPKGWDTETNSQNPTTQLAHYLNDFAQEEESLFDCVIIDEAHYMRNEYTQTHKLAAILRDVSDNMVLLSATPIQLRSDDLFYLLRLIDSVNFEYIDSFKDIIEANKPLIEFSDELRRFGKVEQTQHKFSLKVKKCLKHPLLRNKRQLQVLLENPPSQEKINNKEYRVELANRIERINLLAQVINRTRKKDVHENKVIRYPKAYKAKMTEMEQYFYDEVTNGVREYCYGKDLNDAFILTIPQRQICSSMPAAYRAWKKKVDNYVDEVQLYETGVQINNDKKFESVGPLVHKLAEKVSDICDYDTLKENDSKFLVLLKQLKDYWKTNTNKKIILFSFYKETLRYLEDRLTEEFGNISMVLMGRIKDKHEMIKKFRDDDNIKLLLASEVASEGIDIQFSSFLINYDLPWNPMKVEQRIGRIDRIGQKEDRINILNFFYENTLDDRIYDRLYDRLDIFKETLGDLESILGEQINELTLSLLTHKLTKNQEEERINQTLMAIETVKSQQQRLENEAYQLSAHSDYVLNRVKAAKEMHRFIDGESLWLYITDFLNQKYKGCHIVRLSDSEYISEIQLSHQAIAHFQTFLENNRSLNKTRIASGDKIKCVFTNKHDFDSPKYEVINQYHSLVRFVSDQITEKSFYPLVSAQLSHHDVGVHPGQYLITCEIWSTSGARVVEKLAYKGMDINSATIIDDETSEKIISAAITHSSEWHEIKSAISGEELSDMFDDVKDDLYQQFNEYAAYMKLQNDDQVDFLIHSLQKKTTQQIDKINEIIENLKLSKNEKMIPANQGKIRKLEDNLKIRQEVFEQKRNINTENDLVISGVFYVR